MTKFTNYTPCIVDYEAAMLSALSYCRRNLGRYKMANGDDPMALIAGEIEALLTRHNALVEAVAWLRECEDCDQWAFEEFWVYDDELTEICEAARAEVDRLIGGE